MEIPANAGRSRRSFNVRDLGASIQILAERWSTVSVKANGHKYAFGWLEPESGSRSFAGINRIGNALQRFKYPEHESHRSELQAKLNPETRERMFPGVGDSYKDKTLKDAG